MSSFTSQITVSLIPGGKRWEVARSFTFHIGSKYAKRFIRIPQGFITDFASIPWLLWRLLFFWLPLWAKYNKSSPIHDYLYREKQVMGQSITRKQADDIFREAMLVDFRNYQAGKIIAHLEYWAVRIAGSLAWKRNGDSNNVHTVIGETCI